MKPQILIAPADLKDKRIENKIYLSEELKGCLATDTFYSQYDEEIHAPLGILNVPAIASVLPLAWASNSSVLVDTLDKSYYESVLIIKEKLKILYPNAPMDSVLFVKNLTSSETKSSGYATFFSGGVDSQYSLLKSLKHKPRILTLFGYTHRQWRREHFNKIMKFYKKWAEDQDLKMNIIDTNIRDIFSSTPQKNCQKNYIKALGPTGVWGSLGLTLILMASAAPLSINRFNHIFLAASDCALYGSNFINSRPEIDNEMHWADLDIESLGFIPRQYKISPVLDYIDKTKGILNSCVRLSHYGTKHKKWTFDYNCGYCEKCQRTIVGILIAGKDPREYGFTLNPQTLENIKKTITTAYKYRKITTLRPMQEFIPEKIEQDFEGSKAFLEWFKAFDLKVPHTFNLNSIDSRHRSDFLFNLLVPHLRCEDTILDFHCGNSPLAKNLISEGYPLIGFDINSSNIDSLNERHPDGIWSCSNNDFCYDYDLSYSVLLLLGISSPNKNPPGVIEQYLKISDPRIVLLETIGQAQTPTKELPYITPFSWAGHHGYNHSIKVLIENSYQCINTGSYHTTLDPPERIFSLWERKE